MHVVRLRAELLMLDQVQEVAPHVLASEPGSARAEVPLEPLDAVRIRLARIERRAAQVELFDQFSVELLFHRETSGSRVQLGRSPRGSLRRSRPHHRVSEALDFTMDSQPRPPCSCGSHMPSMRATTLRPQAREGLSSSRSCRAAASSNPGYVA
jgi:hypothetical protein